MKGDFSRGALDLAGVSRVLMQQGRVQLDADWNTAVAALERRTRIALGDLFGNDGPVGPAAVPAEGGGFAITQRGGLVFDGKTTYVRAERGPSLNDRSRVTIDAWIAPRAGGRGGTLLARLDHDRHGRPLGEFALRVDARGRLTFLRVEHARGGDAFAVEEIVVLGEGEDIVIADLVAERPGHVVALHASVPVPFGRISHVAVVQDGHRVALYVDGRFAGERHLGRGFVDTSVPFLGGAQLRHGRVADVFDGTIDGLTVRACAHHHHRRQHRRCRERVLFRLDDGSVGTHPPVRAPRTFAVSAGRAYIGGLLCENALETPLELPALTSTGVTVVYAEVAEVLATSIDDPRLADPALGGLDTAAVVRTQARVRAMPLAQARALLRRGDDRGRLAFVRDVAASVLGNQLVRVEVYRGGYADGTFAPGDARVLAASTNAAHALVVAGATGWTSGQPLAIVPTTGTASTTTVTARNADGTYTVADPLPTGAFGVVPLATVTWSRDNASLAFPIAPTTGPTDRFTLTDPVGRSLGVRVGDIVEIRDAQTVSDGRGALRTVANVAHDGPDTVMVELDAAVPMVGSGGVARVWDAFLADGGSTVAERIVSSNAPVALAEGLGVRCTAGSYRVGDYWWTALRVDVDGLWDWPLDESGAPQALAPQGIERVYAPLALVQQHGDRRARVRDLRRVIVPLGEERRGTTHGAASAYDDRPPSDPDEPDAPPDRRPPDEHHHHHHHHHHDERHEHATLPHEALLLTREPHSPRGYRATGTVVRERHPAPLWASAGAAPFVGRALAVAWQDVVFAYVEATGHLWRYDPAAHGAARWERRRIPDGPARHGAALVAGATSVYLIGGFDDRHRPTRRCDRYDPDDDVWTVEPSLRTARASFGAAVVDGTIVVLGGVRRVPFFGSRFASRRVESFTPGAARWRRRAPLPRRREGCGALAVGRRVYLIGGSAQRLFVREGAVGAGVELVAPFSGEAWEGAPLGVAVRDPRLALVDEGIVVAGGRTALGDAQPTEWYSLLGTGGVPFASLDRTAPGLAALDGTLYAVAGENLRGAVNAVERCRVSTPLYVHRRERDEYDQAAEGAVDADAR